MNIKYATSQGFSGGYNDTSAPFELKKNQLLRAENVVLDEQGGFATRKGTIIYNNLPRINGAIKQYIEWLQGKVSKELIIVNSKLYEIIGNKYVEKKSFSGEYIAYIILKKGLYFTDGTDLFIWESGKDDIKTLTPNGAEDNNLTPIKKCTMFVLHTQSLRVFACGNPDDPTALYFSNFNDMSYFPKTNVVYPTVNEGEITAIAPLSSAIVVSYKNTWYYYAGIDPTKDAVWKPLNIPYGCISHNSLALTPYSMTYLAKDKIVTVSVSILSQELVMIQGEKMIREISEEKVENTIKAIKKPQIACATFYDGKYMLAFNDNEEVAFNNKLLVYNWNSKGFTLYKGLEIHSLYKKTDYKLIIPSNNYLVEGFKGYSDIDTSTGQPKAIVVDVITKFESMGSLFNSKYLKFILLAFKQRVQRESFVDIKILGDYMNVLMEDISLVDSLSWGRAWGLKWGHSDIVRRIGMINKVVTGARLQITNNRLNDPISIYAIGYGYEPLNIKPNMASRREDLLE